MTAITLIRGFVPGEGSYDESLENGASVSELVTVVTNSATITKEEVRQLLPPFGSPGSSAYNPLQLTFTLGQSGYPGRTDLVLVAVTDFSQVEETGNEFSFTATYNPISVPYLELNQEGKRRDQKRRDDGTRITDPTDRPPIFNRSVSTVTVNSFFNRDREHFKHTNGLNVQSPVPVQYRIINMSWTWNVDIEDYVSLEFERTFTTTNEADIAIPIVTGGQYNVTEKKIEVVSFSEQEVYETPSGQVPGSEKEFHYVRLTWGIRIHELDQDLKYISKHTLQRLTTGGGVAYYAPIPVSDKEYATEPWPLDVNGQGISYDTIATAGYDDFGKIETGTPEVSSAIQSVIDKHNLKVTG